MRLHLHEWGDPDAPAVICLHGITAHGLRFRRFAEERLADRFRVLAPDLRGHGRSEPEPPWTFDTFVADVLETIDAAGVGSAAWLGHSFGGRLVVETAATAPERVERAVLLDPALHVLPHIALDRAETPRQTFASPEEAVAARLETDPQSPREFIEEDVEQHLELAAHGRYRFRYCRSTVVSVYGELATQPPPREAVQAPVLIVYSPDFGLVREEHLEAYSDAEILAVPGGHMVYWDAWEQTADAVERFLAA
ncbi:MAG: alpha/beta hydrolase [Actinomycetota bacterium]|nr:alpha/beta hydrolase [Actinomycetota bacterium]